MPRASGRNRHAAQRALERYGLEVWELERAVKEERFEFVSRQSTSRSLCRALVAGQEVWFVLNRNRRELVTVLTPEQAADIR